MNAGWIIPFIILGGALQSCGAAMNGQLNKHVVNPWLASAISFALITFFFAGATLIHPHPLPTQKDLAELPWWGRSRRLGRSRPGLRRPHPRQQNRRRPFRRLHRNRRPDHLTANRPLRLVPNATPPPKRRPHHRRPATNRRHHPRSQILRSLHHDGEKACAPQARES